MTADGNIVFLGLNHKIIAIGRQYLTLEADVAMCIPCFWSFVNCQNFINLYK